MQRECNFNMMKNKCKEEEKYDINEENETNQLKKIKKNLKISIPNVNRGLENEMKVNNKFF